MLFTFFKLDKWQQIAQSITYDQIYDLIVNRFSKYQCDFRIGFNTQNALLSIVEKMIIVRDKKEVCGVMLTDLSKGFDCISHDLVIAKLDAYGFDPYALKITHIYLRKITKN